MEHLTIRNVPAGVAQALEAEKLRRGKSLNQTVIELLAQGLGVQPTRSRSNGLRQLAGGWSAEDLAEFDAAVASTREVDDELWR